MPTKPNSACSIAGCPERVPGSYCDRHAVIKSRRDIARRGTAAERGYDYRWQQYRKHYLRNHPLCVHCEEQDKITPATVVDHITPHRGDKALFWDTDNHQALCATCHNRKTARGE